MRFANELEMGLNTGTPQGDGISPELFILYLERATDDLKWEIGGEYIELSYAEIFVGDQETIQGIEEKIKRVYTKYDLNVNADKTCKSIYEKLKISVFSVVLLMKTKK